MNEFELIDRYFKQKGSRPDVVVGVGDDGALLQAPADHLLVVTTDTLVSGVHFREDFDAFDIGCKALAANLSDLAAMGAEPAWILISLTLPEVNEQWLESFSNGVLSGIEKYNLQLVGGDITKGPLTINIQATGFVPTAKELKRSGAQVGDAIFVTGSLGAARYALSLDSQNVKPEQESIMQRLLRPVPRIEAGILLREFATSAIDISDGLGADLGHIIEQSGVGATISLEDLPIDSALEQYLSQEERQDHALNGGDDYELCFTASADKEEELMKQFLELGLTCTRIGSIESDKGLRLQKSDGSLSEFSGGGYRHF